MCRSIMATMDDVFVSSELPSPLDGAGGNQWSMAWAWHDDGYEMLHGMTYVWEARVMLVYIMLRFLMVGLDGGRTLFIEYIAMLFFDLTSVSPNQEQLCLRVDALEDRYLSVVQHLIWIEFFPKQVLNHGQVPVLQCIHSEA